MATSADQPDDSGRNWQELVATVLLVLAALGTSWSSYQATRWNGEQAAAAGRTNAIRIEASRAQGLGEAQSQVDVATFIAWADADQRGEQDLAQFYVDRFRDEASWRRFQVEHREAYLTLDGESGGLTVAERELAGPDSD